MLRYKTKGGLATKRFVTCQTHPVVSRKSPRTNKRYGITGNTFVAAVEFGDTLKAKTILTGGAGSAPTSPHYTDQVNGYVNGGFKEIFFYKKDVTSMPKRSIIRASNQGCLSCLSCLRGIIHIVK